MIGAAAVVTIVSIHLFLKTKQKVYVYFRILGTLTMIELNCNNESLSIDVTALD